MHQLDLALGLSVKSAALQHHLSPPPSRAGRNTQDAQHDERNDHVQCRASLVADLCEVCGRHVFIVLPLASPAHEGARGGAGCEVGGDSRGEDDGEKGEEKR